MKYHCSNILCRPTAKIISPKFGWVSIYQISSKVGGIKEPTTESPTTKSIKTNPNFIEARKEKICFKLLLIGNLLLDI
jgi:hypothetical protein